LPGPAVGEPDPDWAAPSRTGLRDAAGGVLVLLVLGLAFRLIIAYLLPNSGFGVDIQAFRYWAEDLAREGLNGFYDRPFFHDYTPGYLYVLWVVGKIGQLLGGGGVGDLIKIPAILADVGLGYLVWSMARELGASNRLAWIGAFLVIVNPVSWIDSALWGQVDSVGTVVMLLALRELWRDRAERSAVLAVLAALIKPQLGILIPIVAVVVIRRALWPDGAFGDEAPPDEAWKTRWERATRGPIRILTTGLAGLATAIVLALPFGLSFQGLIQQIFKTAGGYPYVSVNAYNPWALVTQAGNGVAANGLWICDATVRPAGPIDIRIGDFVLWSSPASTLSCANGIMFGALPAVVVGAGLFLVALAITLVLVGRRPDRRTMLVGLAVLAIAFFVLPTRVHERYLYPLIGVGAILAAVSYRWRIAYIAASVAMAANLYAILTWVELYKNPGIADWLGIRPLLASFWGIAAGAIVEVIVFIWAFAQLRDDRLEQLEVEIEGDGSPGDLFAPQGVDIQPASAAPPIAALAPAVAAAAPVVTRLDANGIDPDGWDVVRPGSGLPGQSVSPDRPLAPVWEPLEGAMAMGPIEWVRARFRDRPIRADRSRLLADEPGGRVDRLDIWVLVILVISLLTVRMWRLSEPYGMHFDEVYHARTATEFLQDWRYGISHSIYEWTHPHVAKYAMAAGLVLWGTDNVQSTSELGTAVTDAAIEPRWDNSQQAYSRKGDRLWVATGSEVRAYDLATRALVASVALPGATAVAVDQVAHRVYIGSTSGEIQFIDTLPLDDARSANEAADPVISPFVQLDGPVQRLFIPKSATTIAAVLPAATAGSQAVVIVDPQAAAEVGRVVLPKVTQIADANAAETTSPRIAVADADGVAFVSIKTAKVDTVVRLGGPAGGVSDTSDLTDDPLYASYQASDGIRVATIIGTSGSTTTPHQGTSFALPGATAGLVFFDKASKMVHVVGSVAGSVTNDPTVYVIEPHADPGAVYADAKLPFAAQAIVMDDNGDYPSSDRQQLLAFAPAGEIASVDIGNHAFAWRLPGVLAGVAMAALLYLLARLLFRRREVALILAVLVVADGMLFAQSRIGMNDSYVGLGIVAAYTLFAALWLRPGGTRRHWIAFWIGMPIIGLVLGFALASKWVAAYAIGGLGILVLARSALGRLLLISGLVLLTTVLGYIAISVPVNNYLFLIIMTGLVLAAVVAVVQHPIAWTWEEQRVAIGVPIVAGGAILLFGMIRGAPEKALKLGPVAASPIELAFLAFVGAAAVYTLFTVVGRFGFGPRAVRPAPEDPQALLEPPAPAPAGWLRLGSGFGLPAVWTFIGLIVIPLVVYVISYIPWAMIENHQLWTAFTIAGIHVDAWPPLAPGKTVSKTLIDLTAEMYRYHNSLSVPHPASSPWWAWPFDFKPVWFYEQSFAGGTSASIYDAGNLVAWWLGIPAMAFIAWQSFRRRSAALGLITIAFACQWLSWSRIDRAAFQYHYYTALPFVLLAVAYFFAELWHGPSWRTWVVARLAAAAAVLAPFGLWLLHRPLCGFVRVNDVNPGSLACPTSIGDLDVSFRAIAIAVVVGTGLLLLARVLLSFGDEHELEDEIATGGGSNATRNRIITAAVIAVGTSIAFRVVTGLPDLVLLHLKNFPVEPIALIVTIALLPVAAFVATARDSRRFVIGALVAIGFWFVIWYPNIAALPLPSAIHNAYQGLLPTYVYPFQFPVATGDRVAPSLVDIRVAELLVAMIVTVLAVTYSAWSWRIALAERRRDEAAWPDPEQPAVTG
jgi:4-amino-4-deoxy-L-arabinose transferase-like glycosyltransferase